MPLVKTSRENKTKMGEIICNHGAIVTYSQAFSEHGDFLRRFIRCCSLKACH